MLGICHYITLHHCSAWKWPAYLLLSPDEQVVSSVLFPSHHTLILSSSQSLSRVMLRSQATLSRSFPSFPEAFHPSQRDLLPHTLRSFVPMHFPALGRILSRIHPQRGLPLVSLLFQAHARQSLQGPALHGRCYIERVVSYDVLAGVRYGTRFRLWRNRSRRPGQ